MIDHLGLVANMDDPLYELFKQLDDKWSPQRWFKSDGKPSDCFVHEGKVYSRNEDGTVRIRTSKEVLDELNNS